MIFAIETEFEEKNLIVGRKSAVSAVSQDRQCSAVEEKEYRISEQKSDSFYNSKVTPTNQWRETAAAGAAAYLELRPVLEVVMSGQAGVELHPVARDPGDLARLAAPQLGVAQQGRPLIDIMPSALQSASAWK